MRGVRDGGRFSFPNRREEVQECRGENYRRGQGGWNVVQLKRLKKIDIASKIKLDDEERRNLVSFFFTNFSDSLKAWDMFHLFSIHGRVVEVVIPGLKEGRRKRFGFVRFKDVKDPDMMVIKLDNVFIRGIKLHVNMPRFNREVSSVMVSKKDEASTKEVSVSKEIVGVAPTRDHVQKVWVRKKESVEASSSQLSFDVDDETLHRFRKAMVGEVLWPGKSYTLQEEFSMQGVFWIKVTPLGANLVILEGAADDEDFMGDVEEARDWLLQWLRWLRPWQPEDVDHERVAWIRCFGIPAHAWSGDFFSKLGEHIGVYLYSDDNTEKRKSLDVARVLIRTKSLASLNQSISVCINKVTYPIKLVEDWCGPLQWSQPVEKIIISEEASDSESSYKEEKWREAVESGDVVEENGVEGVVGDGEQEEADGVKDSLIIINSQHVDNGIMENNGTKSQTLSGGVFRPKECDYEVDTFSNSGSSSSSSWVKDTFSSNMGQAHQSIMGSGELGVRVKGMQLESPVRLILAQPNEVTATVLPSFQSGGNRAEAQDQHGDDIVGTRDGGAIQRKDRRYLSVGIPRKSKLWSKPQRVVHELAEFSGGSMGEAPVLVDEGGKNIVSSSSLFSAGTVLCDGSIASSEIRVCNNKFWALQSKAVARRVWETSKKLGVEGSRPEEEYIDIISEGEKRDEAARKKGKSVTGVR